MESQRLYKLAALVEAYLNTHGKEPGKRLTQEEFVDQCGGLLTRRQLGKIIQREHANTDVEVLVGLARGMDMSTERLLSAIGLLSAADLTAASEQFDSERVTALVEKVQEVAAVAGPGFLDRLDAFLDGARSTIR